MSQTQTQVELPERLAQILEALKEPFPAAYIEWKPQSVSKDGKRALAAAYVDARRYQERLDLVCPGWSSHIELLANGQVAKVAITIEGVTREDVGEASSEEANTVTTAVAQAFKRACAAFGLGRYLYFLPQQWCDYDAEKRRIVNPPTLPEWAMPSDERLEKATARAVEREVAERGVQQPESTDHQPAPVAEDEPPDPGAFTLAFGKHQGKTLVELWQSKDGQGYVRWLASVDGKGFQPRNLADQQAQRMARAFLTLQSAYAG